MGASHLVPKRLVATLCGIGMLFIAGCDPFTPPRPTVVPTRTPRIVPTLTPEPPVVVPPGDQVSRGREVYAHFCARCHGPDLQGDFGPRLDVATLLEASGGDAVSGGTAARLYAAIKSQMPYDAPNSLTPLQYYDVTAFLLSENNRLPPNMLVDPSTAPTLRFSLRAS